MVFSVQVTSRQFGDGARPGMLGRTYVRGRRGRAPNVGIWSKLSGGRRSRGVFYFLGFWGLGAFPLGRHTETDIAVLIIAPKEKRGRQHASHVTKKKNPPPLSCTGKWASCFFFRVPLILIAGDAVGSYLVANEKTVKISGQAKFTKRRNQAASSGL